MEYNYTHGGDVYRNPIEYDFSVNVNPLGMLIGYLLKSKTPDGLLSMLAFAIFSIFGVYTLYQGLKLVRASVSPIPVILVLVVVTIAFAGLCAFLFVRREKKKKTA
ncbi:MAG: hypothetical protein PUG98_04435 [Clostridium sp.]|nr:hypothetical protein [Clostridium sp.]